MIDAIQESLLSFAEAAEWLPRQASGKRVSTKTVARWSLVGIAGLTLETIRIGRRRVTSKEACQRFFAAHTNKIDGIPKVSDAPQPSAEPVIKAKLRAKGLLAPAMLLLAMLLPGCATTRSTIEASGWGEAERAVSCHNPKIARNIVLLQQ